MLLARDIDPATDSGLIHLRDSATQLQSELGDPNGKLRTFIASALNGGLRSDVAKLRSGADQLSAGAQQLSPGWFS